METSERGARNLQLIRNELAQLPNQFVVNISSTIFMLIGLLNRQKKYQKPLHLLTTNTVIRISISYWYLYMKECSILLAVYIMAYKYIKRKTNVRRAEINILLKCFKNCFSLRADLI